MKTALNFRNSEAIEFGEIPLLSLLEFRNETLESVKNGARVCAFFVRQVLKGEKRLYAVLAHDKEGALSVLSCDVKEEFPSLTPECPQVHLFEREIFEEWGIKPQGHPWLKPVRSRKPDETRFYSVLGSEVHEVAVGPVHAGIIEPGHFRFQCHGEEVYHLEIALGYQHRGIQRALVGGPNVRTIHYVENVAGDTAVGHTTAYGQVVEALSHCPIPACAAAIRGIALELERLANHTGDLGALAGDVGFLPTASYCGRIRGDFLNITALLCGSRFGRGLVRVGGVGFDMDDALRDELLNRLERAYQDVSVAVELLWNSSSVMSRFEGTGPVSRKDGEELGLVGVVARACGIQRDIRHEFPSGIYCFSQIPVSTYQTGDVFARSYVRWLEIQRSVTFIRDQLEALPSTPIRAESDSMIPNQLVVSLVEGWRGEICHVAGTNKEGKFEFYRIIDPSMHNWMGLAMALRNQQISDFPLCNKSFNLSYCGHDL